MNTKLFSEALSELDDKYVYTALNYHPKRKLRLFPFVASLSVFAGLCGFAYAVSVYQGVGSADHIDFNKLTQPFGTITDEQQLDMDNNVIFLEKSPIINDYENIYADYSVCVETADNQIPSIYFSPNYMVIFSQENEQGWALTQKEKLTLHFSLYHAQSLELEIGYVLNGKYHSLSIVKGCDFSETLTAPEAGEYYICITNHSSSNAVIESGNIQ